jgi:hypothetical protein
MRNSQFGIAINKKKKLDYIEEYRNEKKKCWDF